MSQRRQGYSTVAILLLMIPLTLFVVGLATTDRQFARDERQQEAADAAALAGGRVYARNANAIAALDTAAAETMADLAISEAVCAGVSGSSCLEPGPATTTAILRGSPVCANTGAVIANLDAALDDFLGQAEDLAQNASSQAQSAAEAAAQNRGAWVEVGLSPNDALPFTAGSMELLCARAQEALDERLNASVFHAARREACGAVGWAAFRTTAKTALTGLCGSHRSVWEPGVGETTLVGWVRGSGAAPRWASISEDGELADVAVGGVRLASNGTNSPHDQSWWVGTTPLAFVGEAAREGAPPMPWSQLHH